MAEVDPYAQFVQPVAEVDPYAQFEPKPGVVADVAKTAAPSLLRGTLGMLTTPGTLSNLAGQGAQWAIDKVAPESGAAKAIKLLRETDTDGAGKSIGEKTSFFPDINTVIDKTEAKTGPLYHAQTPIGKGVETALEVAPSLVTGGSVPKGIAQAVGAGVGSETLGQAADAASGILPSWAAPVARGAGAVAGMGLPALARRAVTPLPMAPEQKATVDALRATNPDFVNTATAGQLTNSPRVMALEGRAPRMANQAEDQGNAYSAATLAKGPDTGPQIGQIYDSGMIGGNEFSQLKKDVTKARTEFQKVAGQKDSEGLRAIEEDIKMGASNNPTVSGMTGKRYQYIRDKLQAEIDGAGNNTEKKALSDMRRSLDEAFSRSLPDDAARSNLSALKNDKVAHETLANRKSNMNGPGNSSAITPEETVAAVAKAQGNKAANLDKSPLTSWARNAKGVMQELPEPSHVVPPMVDLGSALAGSLLSGGLQGIFGGPLHAASGAAEGGVFGHLLSHSGYQAAANAAGRAVARPGVQNYLKNQRWLPGEASAPMDRAALIRLLSSPAETQLLPGQNQ